MPKVSKMNINLELRKVSLCTAQSQQNDQFEYLYISSHGEARNIKFELLVNIEKVSIGYSASRGSDVISS